MYCPHCGRRINKNSRFCPYCHYPVQNYVMNGVPVQKNWNRHSFSYGFIITFICCLILSLGSFSIYAHNRGLGAIQLVKLDATALSSNQPRNQTNNNAQNNTQINPNHSHGNVGENNYSSNKNSVNTKKPVNKSVKSTPRPGYTLTAFPSSIQGTWYSYDEGKLQTLTITSKSIIISGDGNGGTETVHSRPKKFDAMNAAKRKTWCVAIQTHVRGMNLVNVRGWNQSAGDGESYGVIHPNGLTILEEAGGAEAWSDSNFYQSKAQAKHNKKKIYKNQGEKGRPGGL